MKFLGYIDISFRHSSGTGSIGTKFRLNSIQKEALGLEGHDNLLKGQQSHHVADAHVLLSLVISV